MMFAPWMQDEPTVVVGLMSGTSLDGIDAAIVRITGSGYSATAELLHYYSKPYEPELRHQLRKLCSIDGSTSAAVCSMNAYLGSRFAEVVQEAVAAAGMQMKDIDLVSSHGQTIWHLPFPEPEVPYSAASTLQIGDISVIAKHTGKLTVGDFRPADMAVGGQGAPFAPYGDLILFRHPERGRLLQNVGGIGNCTALSAGADSADVLAFDTGPGNMVMDAVVHTLSAGRLSYDEGGRWAAQGSPHEGLLDEMMSHPYFQTLPPKSTGRELFGHHYAARFMEQARTRALPDADIVATATAFTARSIADGYSRFVFPKYRIDEVIVTGGGAHNRTLLRMLDQRLPQQKVMTSRALGFDDDAKEAVIFALLGNDFMHGVPNNLPAATGAIRATVMGKLALP
ncbi:anhydro-N-acetylmuramic acid kinase AnmK [Paenibacillus sp. JCM 10914]|uniref:anhydro-N-acetylmuramic acid kinase n=1 Tax=Paenibacillus sp. JCM 10914 TaxID=1236974 RepID=UPI0003CC8E72|nr:anhydro-N-acetylmuramic acid kinase [Paenibacillus sp. JCM 10914]GAE09044.1 anhydro-N-acetylmuramic acid kinase [Paenibacillus sp. JCM 10914]